MPPIYAPVFIQAHLRAQNTNVDSRQRLDSKVQLVRGLHGCGLTKDQIRVNAGSPGPTRTDFGDKAFEKHPEAIKPLARLIADLISDDCGWVTAQDIVSEGSSTPSRSLHSRPPAFT